MKWWIVYRKECLDAARDRRSLAVAALAMTAGPLVVALALIGLTSDETTRGPLRVAIAGAEQAPSLVAWLRAREVVEPEEGSAPEALRLMIDEEYPQQFRAGRSATVVVTFDSSVAEQKEDAARLRDLLESYGGQIRDWRLVARGVDPTAALPLVVETRDLASVSPRAAAALATIPILLMAGAFLGCMNLAIDATAGERERKGLEQLLLHPAAAQSIALGKWAATSTLGALSVVGMLVFLGLLVELPAMRALPLHLEFGWQQVVLLVVLLVPLAALAGSAQLTLALAGSRRRAVRELLHWRALEREVGEGETASW